MNRRGFTLVEALVALVLSSIIIILVASVFLVQNQFYADTVARTGMHENVRGAASYITSELKAVAAGGIVVAQPDSVVFRIPVVVGGVCDTISSQTYILFPLGGEAVDGDEVTGYGARDPSDGSWTYTAATWASVFNSSGSSAAQRCEANGGDTVGAIADYYRLDGLTASPAIGIGDMVMLYQQRVFKLATSVLDPSSTGLFTGAAGDSLTELATGLSAESAFQYLREGETAYQNSVTGGANLAQIRVVRVTLRGIAPPSNPARDSLTFDLVVTVPTKNAN